jgi:ATP-dependent helicase/nuclease subunit A
MAAALQLDGGRYATPYGFVRALRSRTVETQAVPAADAVSLLTVHGAKGLEAPVVFIVDADPNKARTESGTLLVDWPVDDDAPRCVAFVAVDSRPPPSLQALQEEELQARAREELNGLYVAMTRAAEELVISRTEPYQRTDEGSWWARVAPLAQPWIPGEGATAAAQAVPTRAWIDLPDLPRPDRPVTTAAPVPTSGSDDRAKAALGTAVHRVLEWLSRPDADRSPAARSHAAVAATTAAGLAPDQAAEVEQQASAVLDSPACRHFFEHGELAWAGNEVPVVVDGEPGRIDRLVALEEQGARVWWVLDYKLHAEPDAVTAYRAQMAGYLEAVRQAQPGERVVGAFVAAGGRLVVLDD